MAGWGSTAWADTAWAADTDDDALEVGEGISLGCIEIPFATVAPESRMRDPAGIYPGCIEIPFQRIGADRRQPGPIPVPDPIEHRPIRPGCIDIPLRLAAPWVLPQGLRIGAGAPPARLTVSGPIGNGMTACECTPVINDVGTGSYSFNHYGVDPGIGVGDDVTFYANGVVFSGWADQVTSVTKDPGEEAVYTTTVNVTGYASKLSKVIVFPMHGAMAGATVPCAPVEESRVFDWSHVDKGISGGAAKTQDPITEAMKTEHGKQLPDPWPDPTSKWANPGGGWFYGAVKLPGVRGSAAFPVVQVWGVAYDYLEVRIDGVPIIECKNAGQPEFATVPLWGESEESLGQDHWMVYRGITSANGGVMMTVMPAGFAGTYGPPLVHTGGTGGFSFARGKAETVWTGTEVLQRLEAERGARQAGGDRCPSLAPEAGIGNDNQAISLAVGMTYLDVLHQLGESLCNWECHAGGSVRIWPKEHALGVDASTPRLLVHESIDQAARQ